MKLNKLMSIMAFIFLLIFTILAYFIINYKFQSVMNDSFKDEISNIKGNIKEFLEKINKLNEKYDIIKQLNVKQKEEIYYLNNETTKQVKGLINQLNGALIFKVILYH